MAENYDSALEQLQAHGLVVDKIDTSGRFQHVDCSDRPGKKHGWYVAHEITLGGVQYIVGRYGDWRIDDAKGRSIDVSSKGLTEDERAEIKRLRAAQARAEEAGRRQKADEAATRARKIWSGLPDSGTSDYLRRKRVGAWGVRFTHGAIVVPVRDGRGELAGLQFIDGDGSKRFLTGTAKAGAWHWIAEPGEEGPIAIAEGYATGATVHEAMGWATAVVFDAGNIEPVAAQLRKRYPARVIIIAADNDHELAAREPRIGNAGVKKATAAGERIAAVVVAPTFAEGEGRSDWNDLQAEQSLEAVRKQLGDALAEWDAKRDAVASTDFTLDALLKGFVVVHGTSLCWDARRGRLMSIANLKVSASDALVKQWLQHPLRRMVDEEAIVFDPGNTDPRVPKINLFTGWPMAKPEKGRCTRILEHLHNLCGERENVFDWALKWIALPMQRPGTKMQTAIVMYGAEGTGKNLFWNAVLRIYGRWGVLIGQEELESTFNSWESAKLFCVADEVVPRNELRALKGRLKRLVTGERVMVNEKNQPLREERNSMNLVFLSNENQPLVVDPTDRRYAGIRCDTVQPLDYFRAVAAEMEQGGVEAFYRYLLDYDLEDFDAHTKPPDTAERAELIEAGEPAPVRFWREWREGQLPLSYCSARGQDVYRAFRGWCAATGERYAPNDQAFGMALRLFEGQWFKKDRPRFHDGDGDKRPKCYIVLDPPTPPSQGVEFQANNFRDEVSAYLKEQRADKL